MPFHTKYRSYLPHALILVCIGLIVAVADVMLTIIRICG